MITWDRHPLEDSPQQACRTCGSPMVMGVVEASGRRMPLDPEPFDGGNVRVIRLSSTTSAPLLEVLPQEPLAPPEGDDGFRYRTHFATCPQAKQHRRR